MLRLTKEKLKSHREAKVYYIYGKRILQKLTKNKNYQKIRDHCYYAGKYRRKVHSICNLKFNVPDEVPAVFHNSSNYDYEFIIKELANKIEGKFKCLGEITKNYKTFSVPIEKEVIKTDKDVNESVVTISYKIKFIDSAKCQLHYQNLSITSHLINYKCLSCNKNYSNKIDEESKKWFKNTFKFSDDDINKFILLLRKGVYSYDYIGECNKFNETSLSDSMYGKRVCKDFEIKILAEYHDLYLKSDTLILADVFKNFRKMCLKNIHLDPEKFLLVPGLAWQPDLKKTEGKIKIINQHWYADNDWKRN